MVGTMGLRLLLALTLVVAGCGGATPTVDPATAMCRADVESANKYAQNPAALDFALDDCPSLAALQDAVAADPGYLQPGVTVEDWVRNRCADPTALFSRDDLCLAVGPLHPATAEPMALPSGGSVMALGLAIPGLAAADIMSDMQGFPGMVCTGPTPFADGVNYVCEATPDFSAPGGGAIYRIEWVGVNPSEVRVVKATVLWFGAVGGGGHAFGDFLGHIANTLPYEGAKPRQAWEWTVAGGGSRAFGPATFELVTSPSEDSRTLTIRGE